MKNLIKMTLVCAAFMPALAACGQSETEPVAEGVADTAIVAASQEMTEYPSAFAQCIACHKVDAPEHSGIGPHLVGVFGATAGTRGDYAYSEALKQSSIVWDEQTLSDFIENPQRSVSGTRMAFGGISDPEDRQAIIEYLATLK